MAERTDNNQTDSERISVIEIGGYLFGIEILKSREVFPLPQVTPVPNTKDVIKGVFNLRGEIYPLIDISPILGMNPKKIEDTDMVILIEENELIMGIVCDRIHGMRMVENTAVKTARGSVPKIMNEYISGMITDRSNEIFFLNAERLFSSLDISSHE